MRVRNACAHLESFSARDRAIMLDAVRVQLKFTPTQETKNRKQLRPNALARWGLRIGAFRVFYDGIEAEKKVRILAVGIKTHERLFVGGKEYKL